MAQVASGAQRRGSRSAHKSPVIATTQYDIVSAIMIAALIGFILLTAWVTALWLANRRVQTEDDVPMELLILGGYEDGKPNETLKVESPEDPTDDPAVVDNPSENTEITETFENVVTLSNKAAQQVPPQDATGSENTGKVGSRDGTGGRPLGSGGGEGNFTQRWFIRFDDSGTVESYAKQLDSFGISLGLYQDKKIEQLSNLSGSVSRKTFTSGKTLKKQHYFTWAGGGRKKADIKLLKKKAGLDARNGIIFHFYPQKAIRQLAAAEKAEADKQKRKVKNIQRTYFNVRKKGSGYEFVVLKITYK